MKSLLLKLLPKSLLLIYHKSMAIVANFYYGKSSEKLIVIGVTGTNGKSSTCRFIADILKTAGHKVGLTSTVEFEIAGRHWLNDKKMTMLGRFALQKMIADMVSAGCTHAVIETSSEGIKQFRHYGINYDLVVFTNLTPEHLESHGGFENYRAAKGELFKHLTTKPHKNRLRGRGHVTAPSASADQNSPAQIPKISVINLDDEHASYFLQFPADQKFGYAVKTKYDITGVTEIRAKNLQLGQLGFSFTINNTDFNCPLLGEFNALNCLAAITTSLALNIKPEIIKEAVLNLKTVPGRLEIITREPFTVIVDQAPEPAAMKKLYEAISTVLRVGVPTNTPSKIIHLLGSCGGGRDKARRPILGELAAKFADYVIITNEDPYDENPETIINEVTQGALKAGKTENKNLFKILDRREAIRKALELAASSESDSEASESDSDNIVQKPLVLITGKGAEQAICIAGGKKIKWDDRIVVREELDKLK